MQILYNPSIDLICAMAQYALWDELTGSDIPGYTVSPALEKWYRKVKATVPGFLHNDICFLINNFLGLLFLPVELAVSEEISSAPELIEAFRGLEPESLPQRIFNSYSADAQWEAVRDQPEKIKAAVEKAGGTTRKQEARFFLDFCRNPGQLQLRFADMTADFYRIAIEPYEEDSAAMMKAQAAEDQKLLNADPSAFFSDVLRIKRNAAEPEPQLFISLYNEIDVIQLDSPLAVIYGKSRSRFEGESGIPLEHIYSLLADESRRTILKMLCRKPLFIREIADELELTSATVSYHMSRLSSLDLVTYERGERKRVYYCADRKKVKAMFKTLEDDIMGQGA